MNKYLHIDLGRIKGLEKGSCYSPTKLFDNETLFVSNKRNIIVVSFLHVQTRMKRISNAKRETRQRDPRQSLDQV